MMLLVRQDKDEEVLAAISLVPKVNNNNNWSFISPNYPNPNSTITHNDTSNSSNFNSSPSSPRKGGTGDVEHPKVFYDLDPTKFLIFRNWSPGGFSNQMQCLNLAAIFAVQYNRTLLLPRTAYAPNRDHDENSVLMEDLFDATNIALSHKILSEPDDMIQEYYGINWAPNTVHDPNLLVDPRPLDKTIRFQCEYGYAQRVFDPNKARQAKAIFFPFHQRFWNQSRRYYQMMQQRVGLNASTTGMKLLTLQVRLGDRHTWPLFTCADNALVHPTGNFSNCQFPSNEDDRIEWLDFLSSSGGLNLVSKGYDAVFIATNKPNDVRAALRENNNNTMPAAAAPVFFLDELEQISAKNLESVKRLVVEELLILLGDRLIPSNPSSITEQLLRMRVRQYPQNVHDAEISRAFWKNHT